MEKWLLPEYDEWKKSRPKPDRSKYMKERYQRMKEEELKKSLSSKRMEYAVR